MILVINPQNYNLAKQISNKEADSLKIEFLSKYNDKTIILSNDYDKIQKKEIKVDNKLYVNTKIMIIKYQEILRRAR